MSTVTTTSSASASQRIEELGRIIMAYSEITEKLQQSHEKLEARVRTLQEELSEKKRQLERRNRLAALGEMAAGMAHEIRNPLGGIQLYASLLAKDVAELPASAELVRKISGGVKRLESLVSQVLQFTREMRPSIVKSDLATVVQEAAELARGRAEALEVQIEVDGPSELPAQIDPLLIGQAVLNLLLNGVEACELRDDRSRGCTSGAQAPSRQVSIRYGASENGQLFLSVEDSGPGVSAEVMDRIFNPFFTTKDNGTGLGLAIVHRIVEAHDGSILVTNRETGGAKFEIRV